MVLDPLGEVLAPFCAANQSILGELEHDISVMKDTLTSSPSQLAMTIVLKGLHPFFNRAPKPRIASETDTVPEIGSLAPVTQADRYISA
jgi:hypothetical protein